MRTLEQIKGRPTRYEVVAEAPGFRARIGFTSRPSKMGLLSLAQDSADELVPHIGEDNSVRYSFRHGLKLGALTIRKSGKTQRDIILEEMGV